MSQYAPKVKENNETPPCDDCPQRKTCQVECYKFLQYMRTPTERRRSAEARREAKAG